MLWQDSCTGHQPPESDQWPI